MGAIIVVILGIRPGLVVCSSRSERTDLASNLSGKTIKER